MAEATTFTGTTEIKILAGEGIRINKFAAEGRNAIQLKDPYLNTVPALLLAITRSLIKSGVIDRVQFLKDMKQSIIDITYAPDNDKEVMLAEAEITKMTIKLFDEAEKILYGLENEGKKVLNE